MVGEPEILACRFDWVERFPVIESLTTPGCVVTIKSRPRDDGGCLALSWQRGEVEGEARVVLGLPLASIGGTPEWLVLEMACSDVALALELDASCGDGGSVVYRFTPSSGEEWIRSRADVNAPHRFAPSPSASPAGVVPPLQMERLAVLLPPTCDEAEVRLSYLTAHGPCHVVPSGLA